MTVRESIEHTAITDVWRELGGGDLRHGRSVAFWRRGADGRNVSVVPSRGVWHDFATGQGGGVLDLIQTARGGSRAEALQWLADHLGVDLDGGPERSPADRRRLAREAADRRAAEARAANWKRARVASLEAVKAQAFDGDDLNTLEATSSELWALQQAAGPGLIDRWRAARRTDPAHADACEAWGADDIEQAEAITALAVEILGAAA